MRPISYFLLFLFSFSFISCKKDYTTIPLLKQAQEIVDSDPVKALVLLDSIHTPENMDQDNYMQYIVIHVRAKYKIHQDISNETLIFEAQKYFNNNSNSKQATIANYYAGCVYRDNQIRDKSLESFLHSGFYAAKIGDNILSAKVFDNIGALYFQEGIMDSAIANYEKALSYYIQEEDLRPILRVSNIMGRSYEAIGLINSAYVSFNNAYKIAIKLDDKRYISLTAQNLGVTYCDMGKYDEAIKYFRSTLNMQATQETQKRQIYMSLLKIYTIKQDTSGAREYALKIEESLPEVTYIHTTKEMYAALSNYYKLTGNYKQALQYNILNKITIQQIKNEESPAALLNADKTFYLMQKDKKIDKLRKYNNYTRFVTELF